MTKQEAQKKTDKAIENIRKAHAEGRMTYESFCRAYDLIEKVAKKYGAEIK